MTFDDIDFEMEQLNFKKDAELRKLGWTQTSSTPGNLWLWRKEIQGYGVMYVNRDSAIYMARHDLEIAVASADCEVKK